MRNNFIVTHRLDDKIFVPMIIFHGKQCAVNNEKKILRFCLNDNRLSSAYDLFNDKKSIRTMLLSFD